MINMDYIGATVSVILRLRQISTLVQPYYTFQLQNKNDKTDIWMSAEDQSPAQGLYQEFWLRNGVNGLTGGNFIGKIGEYSVTVYDTATRYNIDPSLIGDVLCLDTMRIYGTSSPTINSYTQSDSNTFVTYGIGN